MAASSTPSIGSLSFRYGINADDLAASAAERALTLFRQGQLDQAIPLLRQGADEGDRRAQYLLATALFNGDGIERDVDAAFRWMRSARDAGLGQAAESLAEMARLVPDHVDAPAQGDGELLSPAALDLCRLLVAERLPPAPTGSLGQMVRTMVAAELRGRLDDLVPEALARSL